MKLLPTSFIALTLALVRPVVVLVLMLATGLRVQGQTSTTIASHRLAVAGTHFMLDEKPFPYTGLNFFNAIYNPTFIASSEARRAWLKKIQSCGINVLRVWCQWDNTRGFVDASTANTIFGADGVLRPTPLARLKAILADADRLGVCLEIVIFAQ